MGPKEATAQLFVTLGSLFETIFRAEGRLGGLIAYVCLLSARGKTIANVLPRIPSLFPIFPLFPRLPGVPAGRTVEDVPPRGDLMRANPMCPP